MSTGQIVELVIIVSIAALFAIAVPKLLGMLLLVVPVVWLNRPRFLVPPPQRDDPGALAEWRAVRARR